MFSVFGYFVFTNEIIYARYHFIFAYFRTRYFSKQVVKLLLTLGVHSATFISDTQKRKLPLIILLLGGH